METLYTDAYLRRSLYNESVLEADLAKICLAIKKNELVLVYTVFHIPSFYINVSNFYEYLGHPKSKFQNALKNARVEIGVYLLYTKFSIFQCRFDTKFFRIFGPVFTVKFKIYHLNSTNLFTGLGFSTYPFLW